MKKNTLLLMGAVGIGIYLLTKSTVTAAANPTGLPISTTLSTAQMITAINNWYETSTPPNQQMSGSFEDIVASLDPASIQNIYTYITQYILQGTKPAAGTPLYNAIASLQSEYNLFNS